MAPPYRSIRSAIRRSTRSSVLTGVLAGYSLGYSIRQDTAVSIHLYSPPLKDQDYQSADGHRKTLP